MKPQQQAVRKETTLLQQSYQGPVPLPEDLQKYEQITPGFANRLITMAEKEQDTRLSLQKKKLDEDIKLQYKDVSVFRTGQIFAMVSVILIIGLCAYGFYLGFATQSATIACSVIVGSIGAFIWNKKQ